MNKIITVSWKNVWRSKLRSLIVITAVAVGMFGGLFSAGVMKGMSEERVHRAISNEIAHIQVHQTGFTDNMDMHLTIKQSDDKVAKIQSLPEVAAASARLKIQAMAQTASNGTGITLFGVHPTREKQVSGLAETIPDSMGRYFEGDSRNPAVVGQKLAEKLNLNLRSKVVITFQDTAGTLTGAAFRVAGIFNTTNSLFEETNVFVQSDDLRRLTHIPADESHEIAVRLTRNDATDAVLSELVSQHPDLLVQSWKQLQPDLRLVTEFLNVSLFIIMIIILFALSFGIVNTMLMVVLERVKELGMLMAIGMNKWRIFSMIMYETIFLSLTGGVAGMLLGHIFISYFHTRGIDVGMFSEGLESVGYGSVLYPDLDTPFYFMVGGLIVLTAIISSIYPALKALKLNPSEALRTE